MQYTPSLFSMLAANTLRNINSSSLSYFFHRFFISPCLSQISARRSSSTFSTSSSVSIFLQTFMINPICTSSCKKFCSYFTQFLLCFILKLTQSNNALEKRILMLTIFCCNFYLGLPTSLHIITGHLIKF